MKKKIIEEKTDWLKFSVAIGLGMILGAIGMCLIILSGGTEQFLTDQECDNLTLESYNDGLYEGQQLTLINILNTTISCQETFKINVGNETVNETYELFLLRCLNLNNQEVNK